MRKKKQRNVREPATDADARDQIASSSVEVKAKHPGGSPSLYNADLHIELARMYAQEEFNYQCIADRLGIEVCTLREWRYKYPEFASAIKEGRDRSINKVIRSMFKRAQGYEYEEEEITGTKGSDGKIIANRIVQKKKHMAPDVAAAMCLLTNWDPANYQHKTEVMVRRGATYLGDLEHLSDEELDAIIAGKEIGAVDESESEDGQGEAPPFRLPPGGDGKPMAES